MRRFLLPVALVVALTHTAWMARSTLYARFERDIARIVFNDNLELLQMAERDAGVEVDSLQARLAVSPLTEADTTPYIVVSIADRRLWYRLRDSVLFTVPAATGSGRTLVVEGGRLSYRFETPRGRMLVQRRDSAPLWVPPEWHYEEQARKRGLGLVRLNRGEILRSPDGSELFVSGSDVMHRAPDGTVRASSAEDGREIVFDGMIVIPPFGTNQRKYSGVLGPYRLYLGDGYAIHGTNVPASVGQAVSHGCVRLRNEDITHLYNIVPVGTPVYIY